MYLWIVLATFITMIYSYNLSVRADLERFLAETKAEVILTRFLAQHNAVKEYLNAQAPEKIGQSRVPYYPGDGFNSSTGHNFAPEESSPEDGTDQSEAVNIAVSQYLPYGFQNDGSTVSKVFCLEEGNPNKQCESGADGSCCSDEFIGVYVVSFRKIPERWFNKSSGRPNADLLGAMGRAPGFGRSFGYIDEVDGKLAIAGSKDYEKEEVVDTEGNVTEVDNLIYHEIFGVVKEDGDFQDLGCDKPENHCLYAIQQIYG